MVDPSFVRKHARYAWDRFIRLVNKQFSLQEFAQQYAQNEDFTELEIANPQLLRAYQKLQADFKKSTKLSLSLDYHDADNEGDRYDEVDGCFWSVGGVWKQTTAGKKYKNDIEHKLWVVYG